MNREVHARHAPPSTPAMRPFPPAAAFHDLLPRNVAMSMRHRRFNASFMPSYTSHKVEVTRKL